MNVEAVDIFCGAGGLSLGLQQAGLRIAAGIDVDPACKYPFTANICTRFLQRDVTKLSPAVVRGLYGNPDVRVLAGCAPCQPFSGYTTGTSDGRWQLLLDFLRIAKSVRADVVTLENVPRLSHRSLWEEFTNELASAGYNVSYAIVDAAHHGVPQSRRRLVLLASRLGRIGLPVGCSNSPKSVRSAIEKLPAIAAGHEHPADPLHASRALTKVNLRRIKASKQGGTWRDWPDELQVECHRRTSGKTYPSVYGRMTWDRPAPTITTQFYGYGNGRFGHPEQNRALTLREGALLQSFPCNFDFHEPGSPVNFKMIGRLIGNAVPPGLGLAIGKTILDHLKAN